MKDRLTQFGTKCREFRSRYNLTMGDQAKGLGLSVAYISAIERGKRPVPEDYPRHLSEWMSLPEQDSRILGEIASGERTVVKVFPKNRERALLAEDFARDLNGLSAEAVKQLREVLRTFKRGEYSDDEIRKRAYLARAVFCLGEQVSFDVLRIVENQLPIIDPDFSLQIDPDGSLGEHLQIYSDSDGKSIYRFVSTEWLYNAADRGTDDSRFKLAHEIAHWILHRTQARTYLRSPRTNKILSKLHAKAEREADLFAREFLIPLAVVERFESADELAKAAQVPLWVAKHRLREASSLTPTRRENIRRLATEAERAVLSTSSPVVSVLPAVQEASTVGQPGAAILHFPKICVPRRGLSRRKTTSTSLPLFDYAEGKQEKNSNTSVNRSDQWFADFGWRG
jgi:Zn-dependent peptidase ImmA (M78 family)/transcriptional regulator with XRE-family HTH domain